MAATTLSQITAMADRVCIAAEAAARDAKAVIRAAEDIRAAHPDRDAADIAMHVTRLRKRADMISEEIARIRRDHTRLHVLVGDVERAYAQQPLTVAHAPGLTVIDGGGPVQPAPHEPSSARPSGDEPPSAA